MSRKITSIEGLRTIGWVGVFLCHFKGAFMPNAHWWTDDTPLRFIYSGNAYVRLFFVISGFVISYKYFTKENYDRIPGDVLKRYFRLMPSVLFAELFTFVLMRIGAMKNFQASIITGSETFLGIFNQFTPNLLGCLKEALFTTYLNGANGYIPTLWTMVYEYLGVLLVLAVLQIFRKSTWRWLFYLLSLTFFSNYYNYFIIGMVVCDLYVNFTVPALLKKHKVMHAGITILGYLLLSMVNLSDADKYSRVVFGLGLMLFLLGVLSSDFCEKIFGNRVMVYGGKLAYSAYIIHWPIVESFTCGLFLLLHDKVPNGRILMILLLIATFMMIVIVAGFMEKFIEPIGASFASKITEKEADQRESRQNCSRADKQKERDA